MAIRSPVGDGCFPNRSSAGRFYDRRIFLLFTLPVNTLGTGFD
jgi:hypothetical protein